MHVNVYRDGDSEPEQIGVHLRDVVGDDDAAYYRAQTYLQREGRYWIGGGAAPLFCLFRCADPAPVTF